MMEGEDGESESEGSFNSKSVWARIAVVAAGPVFNFILAFLLALIVIGTAGFDRPEVKGVMEGYPAEEAGLQAGDTITAINGTEIADGEAYDAYLEEHPLSNEPVEITYDRDGLDYTATITPREYRTPQLDFLIIWDVQDLRAAGAEIRSTGD